jgi:hypothetical protein
MSVFLYFYTGLVLKILVTNTFKNKELQKIISRLFSYLMKSWSWVLLILSSILIKLASWYPQWVEDNYTYGIYPAISGLQRLLFGWLPLSVGDLFYGFLVLVILYKTFQFFKLLFRKKITRKYFTTGLQQIIFFFLFVYVFFNLLWGLNYNRKGISYQVDINVQRYSMAELNTLTHTIQNRLNGYAGMITMAQRDSFSKNKALFRECKESYAEASKQFSFLKYQPRSVKSSLYSYAGNYLGFQGYYNPFSGEAQVNTTIPKFYEPFVTMHEIAHQLGYAKENEANFAAFLACRYSQSPVVKYSMYFDMYLYTINEVIKRDTNIAKSFQQQLHPQIIKDIKESRDFYKRHKNPIEPIISRFYGHYLKANNQPGGKETYNEVVAWLIAYYKKYGIEAL